jgi:hypothetical protein
MSDFRVDTVRPERPDPNLHLFNSWLLCTVAGWLVGLSLVIVAAVLGDLLGPGGFRFMVGLGMGAGVGLMQERIVRYWFGPARPWLWSSVIGIGAPFMLSDLLTAIRPGLSVPLLLNVGAGGLLAGYLQARFLKKHVTGANRWIVACIAGWALAAATTLVSGLLTGVLSGFYGALINLALILLGGVVLGAVTGLALLFMLRR